MESRERMATRSRWNCHVGRFMAKIGKEAEGKGSRKKGKGRGIMEERKEKLKKKKKKRERERERMSERDGYLVWEH